MNCLRVQMVAGVCCNPHARRKACTPNLRRTAAHSDNRVLLQSIFMGIGGVSASELLRRLVVFLFILLIVNRADRPTFG